MAYQVATAATGVARDAHYAYAPTMAQHYRSLLLEQQRTNLCIRSEEFGSWSNSGSCTVTADTSLAPDGTATADLLTATSGSSARFLVATFTADGEKVLSVFAKAGTSTFSRFQLRDTTAAATRHQVQVAWSGGVPTLSTTGGAGTLFTPVPLGNGWYRCAFTVTGVVAANNNEFSIFPDIAVGTNNALFWGAQAENATSPSSYIPTTTTTVTRNADSCYFNVPSLVPREMTVYVRGVELGVAVTASERLWQISDAAGANPRLIVNKSGGQYIGTWDPATATSTAAVGTATAGHLIEARLTLSSAGEPLLGISANNGAESVSTLGTAQPLSSSFSATRLYLNSVGATSIGMFAFTNVAIALGTQTRATMRGIAGVS